VPVLTTLLERLRRMQPPPGPAAGVLAVPSAGDQLTGEVSFLFADLDEIEHQRQRLLETARSDAANAEQTATRERSRILLNAHEEGERRAATILEERRAQARRRTRAMLARADRDAAEVRERAQERMPAVVAEIVERLLKDTP
jgi:flagellar biosynthesis/type III secretory pathway protein FliH